MSTGTTDRAIPPITDAEFSAAQARLGRMVNQADPADMAALYQTAPADQARERLQGGVIMRRSKRLRESLAESQNWRCPCCGVHFAEWGVECDAQPTLEHIRPKVAGGTDHRDNLAITCRKCNQSHIAYKQAGPLLRAWAQGKDWAPEAGGSPTGPPYASESARKRAQRWRARQRKRLAYETEAVTAQDSTPPA